MGHLLLATCSSQITHVDSASRMMHTCLCERRPKSGGTRMHSAQNDNNSDVAISDTEDVSKRSKTSRGAAASQPATSADHGAISSGLARAASAALHEQVLHLTQPEVDAEGESSQLNAAEAASGLLGPQLHSTGAPNVSTSQRVTRQHHQSQSQPMQPSTADAAHSSHYTGQHAGQAAAVDDSVASDVHNDMPSSLDGSRQRQQLAGSDRSRLHGPTGYTSGQHASPGSQRGPGSLEEDEAALLAGALASAGNHGVPSAQPQLHLHLSEGPSALLSCNESGMQHSSSVMAPITESHKGIEANIRNCSDEELGCVQHCTMSSLFFVAWSQLVLQVSAMPLHTNPTHSAISAWMISGACQLHMQCST